MKPNVILMEEIVIGGRLVVVAITDDGKYWWRDPRVLPSEWREVIELA